MGKLEQYLDRSLRNTQYETFEIERIINNDMYDDDDGLSENRPETLLLIEKYCVDRMNEPVAQYFIATLMSENLHTCPASKIDIIEDLMDANISRGNSYTLLGLAKLYRRKGKKDEATKFLKQSAEKGNGIAQYILGREHREGGKRYLVDKNPQEAFRLFTLSAAQQYTNAQYELACCYIGGFGVDYDQAEAAKWMQVAVAVPTYIPALNMAGYMYHFGIGVEKDLLMAVAYYNMADLEHYTKAMTKLDNYPYPGSVNLLLMDWTVSAMETMPKLQTEIIQLKEANRKLVEESQQSKQQFDVLFKEIDALKKLVASGQQSVDIRKPSLASAPSPAALTKVIHTTTETSKRDDAIKQLKQLIGQL